MRAARDPVARTIGRAHPSVPQPPGSRRRVAGRRRRRPARRRARPRRGRAGARRGEPLGSGPGANNLGVEIADPEGGACRDGLGPDGCSLAQGAESTIAWLTAVEHIRSARARWPADA